tara:strand:+ start:3494 stop:3862 length:369 start_codon:yes stop_codon:yes gene_type:complete
MTVMKLTASILKIKKYFILGKRFNTICLIPVLDTILESRFFSVSGDAGILPGVPCYATGEHTNWGSGNPVETAGALDCYRNVRQRPVAQGPMAERDRQIIISHLCCRWSVYSVCHMNLLPRS